MCSHLFYSISLNSYSPHCNAVWPSRSSDVIAVFSHTSSRLLVPSSGACGFCTSRTNRHRKVQAWWLHFLVRMLVFFRSTADLPPIASACCCVEIYFVGRDEESSRSKGESY